MRYFLHPTSLQDTHFIELDEEDQEEDLNPFNFVPYTTKLRKNFMKYDIGDNMKNIINLLMDQSFPNI